MHEATLSQAGPAANPVGDQELEIQRAALETTARALGYGPKTWWDPAGCPLSESEEKRLFMYQMRLADELFAKVPASQVPDKVHAAMERQGWSYRRGTKLPGWKVTRRLKPLPLADRWLLLLPASVLRNQVAKFLVDPDYSLKGWGSVPERRPDCPLALMKGGA